MKPSVYWAISFLLLYISLAGSQVNIAGIVVTPDRNQTVPFASDENITYTCSVDGGRTAIWEVRGRQIIGQDQARMFAESGFFVEGLGTSESIIRVSGEARRNASQNDPPGVNLLCVAVEGLTGTPGKKFFIITYDPPIPPLGLNLVLMAGNPAPTLWLVWEQPFNVDPQVDISYTVEINSTRADGMHYGPFQNINQTSLPIDFPEALHSNRSCQMYEFFVSAINGAGSSVPSRYLETLPITTDVTNISQTIQVDSIDLQNGRGVAFTVSFKTLKSCSENFPIQNYTININNSREFPLRPSSLPPPGNTVTIELNDRGIPELLADVIYSLSVTACSDFTCKESNSTQFHTGDLQSALVVFFENNVYLGCVLARNSPALGCSIMLSLATNTNTTQADETFDLLRTMGESNSDDVILSSCNMTTNRNGAYDETRIMGVAIQEGGSLGGVSLQAAVQVVSEGNFTNCTLPQQGGGGNRALAIALPIVFVLLLLVTILTAGVFLYFYLKQRRKYKKQPSITTDHVDDDDMVVCEVKFKNDEFTKLLKPEGSQVKRSASAPVNVLHSTTSTAGNGTKTPSTSSSHNDEVFRDPGMPSRDGKRVPYLRSVSDNYKVNTYEVELDKRSVRLKLHRPGLRQYNAAKRSMSEGGSGSGSSGGGADSAYPRVSSCLKLSEDLQSLLSDENLNADLDTLHEESEPDSPASGVHERTFLAPSRSDSGNKSNASTHSTGITFKTDKKQDGGSITGL